MIKIESASIGELLAMCIKHGIKQPETLPIEQLREQLSLKLNKKATNQPDDNGDNSDEDVSCADADLVDEGHLAHNVYERIQGSIQSIHARAIILLENMREKMVMSTIERRKRGEIKGSLSCTMSELIVREAKSSLTSTLKEEGLSETGGEMNFSIFCKQVQVNL